MISTSASSSPFSRNTGYSHSERSCSRPKPKDGQVIPYHLLPSLGGNNTHRAYGDFRFRDNHMLVLSAEYRWTPSRILDMAFFVDAGKVANERRDLDFNGLKTWIWHRVALPWTNADRVAHRPCSWRRGIPTFTSPAAFRSEGIAMTFKIRLNMIRALRPAVVSLAVIAAITTTADGQKRRVFRRRPDCSRGGLRRMRRACGPRSVNLIYDESRNLFGNPGDKDMNKRARASTPSTRCPIRPGSPIAWARGR